jgi:hypothetical protein
MKKTAPFSLVTNVSLADGLRIRRTLPHWLRVFDGFEELLLVFDTAQPSGRIKKLHNKNFKTEEFSAIFQQLTSLDPRIRILDLPLVNSLDYSNVIKQWFKIGKPVRCQAGTPIFAFIYAIHKANYNIVFRSDCDMLFSENGWLEEAMALLTYSKVHIVEPPRLGLVGQSMNSHISTRAFLMKKDVLYDEVLPIYPHKLNFPRRIHRAIFGRPPWLALEQMLSLEKMNGRLNHVILNYRNSGFSMHVAKHEQMALHYIDSVIEMVERGEVEGSQQADWNFVEDYWPSLAKARLT